MLSEITKNRYFIEIQYDGSKFSGWQKQPHAMSVQETLEDKLSQFLREKIEIVGAGRTDAGVHASGQWAHFDVNTEISTAFLFRINQMLPYSIAIKSLAKPINNNFHARFDAVKRSYIYRIARKKNPFLIGQSWQNCWNLNENIMQEAANLLLSYQDFSCFEKKGGDNFTSNCQIFNSFWHFTPDIWEFHITANRFLRGMVRAIVGTIVECGKEKITIEQLIRILESKDRSQAAQNAPPEGLFLSHVYYGDNNLQIIQY